jgi:hypothetical protein
MKKTFVLFFSLLAATMQLKAQEEDADSLLVPSGMEIGIELSGPLIYAADSSLFNLEVRLAYRLNRKYHLVAEPGIGRYSYSQYNYSYKSGGFYLRAGTDINLMRTKGDPGNHFAGLGLRYGIALFNQETPSASWSGYWGEHSFSVDPRFVHAHFLEVSGGVRGEIFRNILIGWSIRGRILLYQSAGSGARPVMVPGIGSLRKSITPAFSYHLIWIIPFTG